MTINIGLPADGVPDQGWKLYITSLVFILVAGLFVIARCATRAFSHKLGADDYTIAVSLAVSIFLSIAIQLAVVKGYGKHKADLTLHELEDALKLFFIAQTPYKVLVCLNKTSIVLLYMRIFISRNFQRICYGALAIIIGWSFAAICATIFQCVPIEGSWNQSTPARCIDQDVFWVAYAVLNILTDVMVLALPLPQVFKLQLKSRDRLMLSGIFLPGGFVTVTSIFRTTAVASSVENKKDITYNFIPRSIWTLIEANLGIICACLPILKHHLTRIFPRLFGSTRNTSAYQYAGGGQSHSHGKHYELTPRALGPPMQSFWTNSKSHHTISSISGGGADPWPLRESDEEAIIAGPATGMGDSKTIHSFNTELEINKQLDDSDHT